MTWYPAYLDSKQDIVDWVDVQNPNITVDTIKDVDVKMADTAIFAYLRNHHISVVYAGTVTGSTVTPSDINNMLWAASLAYNCEFLSYRGIIHFNVGGVQEVKHGSVTHKFMRMQPMFFIPRGQENLDPVMPFRSFKQIAQGFMEAYIHAHQSDVNLSGAAGVSIWDATSRGFGAIADLEDYMDTQDDELTGTSYS